MQLDLETCPLSARGSYLSLATPRYGVGARAQAPKEGEGLYLRTNRAARFAERELVKLEPTRDGVVVAAQIEATPTKLTISDTAGGLITMALHGSDGLSIAGTGGLGLRIRKAEGLGVVGHPDGDRRWVFNCRPSFCRVGAQLTQGEASFDAEWAPDQCRHIQLDVTAHDAGTWQLALTVFQSTWPLSTKTPSVTSALKQQQKSWNTFRKNIGALKGSDAATKAADEASAYVLWSNIKPSGGLFKREAMLMSLNWMDNVWSWDNCFNAVGVAGDEKLALDQILVMADNQDEFGAYPDAVNNMYAHYNYSKPPVQAWAIKRLAQNKKFWNKSRLKKVYKSVAAFTQWWLDYRRHPGENLCHYLHGNDSGWDNSTMFDDGAPLRAPDLNAFLVIQANTLSWMAQECAGKRQAAYWTNIASQLHQALLSELWGGDQFIAKRHDGHVVRSQSLVPHMPIVLGKSLPAKMRKQLVQHIEHLATPWGVATEHPQSERYTDDGYWRGPVWAPSTMLIVDGLRASGANALAKRISAGFCAACESNGFAENFDAQSGAGLRDRSYTWTASVYRTLKGQKKR